MSDIEKELKNERRKSAVKKGLGEIWKQAIVMIPILAWNDVISSFIMKIYPAETKKNKAFTTKIGYAIVTTIIIIIVFLIYFETTGDQLIKDEKKDQN